MARWLIDALENIQGSNALEDIKTALVDIRERLDCNHILYAIKIPNSFTRSANLIVSDYPEKWMERYAECGYVNIDPVARHCFTSQAPYSWNGFKEQNDFAVRAFASEARDFGLYDGISVGMPRFDGESGLISMAVDHHLAPDTFTAKYITLCINSLQPYIHERIRILTRSSGVNTESIQLTEREKDCLLWTAEGKTAQEIATILTISEATVVFHLKNAVKKLHVTNRSQAVAKAVLLGLILPQYSTSSVPTYHF